MKKFLLGLVGFALIFMLAACNQSEPAQKDEDENNSEQQEQQNDSENEKQEQDEPKLTAEDVFEKTKATSKDIESFEVKMDVNQEMGTSSLDKIEFGTSIDMNMTMEPLALYQKMTMTADGESVITESYFTDEGMYIYEDFLSIWVEYPSEQIMEAPDENQAPMAELKQLEEFVGDISLQEEDDHYVLTLSETSGDKFNDLIRETMEKTLPEQLLEEEEFYNALMNDFEINKIEYEFLIEKETFYPLALDMVIDMDIAADEDTVKLVQTTKADYTNYNTVDEITIPQEAVDEAITLEELMQMEFEE